MESTTLVLALLMPPLLGMLCVHPLIGGATPGRTTLVAGYGTLLGLLVVPLLVRLLDTLGVTLDFTAVGSLVAALIVLLALAQGLRNRARRGLPPASSVARGLSASQKALLVLFLLLIALRITTLGLELLWRPLYPWDATMHWATKARVWFELRSLAPFVEHQQWLDLGGTGVYTDNHPGYPITTPLLQLWMSLAIDRWDESLINLPWLLCCLGLLAAFYGQARAVGSSPLAAVIFTYMLLSMPLLGTHVALAGYADLFLGACYGASLMAFYNWSVSRERGQAVLAMVFALFCPLIKNEGFYWLLTFVPALIVLRFPARRSALILAGAGVILALTLLLIPQNLSVAGHSLRDLHLYYRPLALAGIASSVLLQDNWHLLGYLLPALLLMLMWRKPLMGELSGMAAALFSAIVLLLLLFLFTRYSLGAMRFTAVGRISLHLVPALLFFCLLLWQQVIVRFPTAPRSAIDGNAGVADRLP